MEREISRLNKKWEDADRIREEIKNLGYQVNDTKDGVVVLKV